jgi:hypothetical protein
VRGAWPSLMVCSGWPSIGISRPFLMVIRMRFTYGEVKLGLAYEAKNETYNAQPASQTEPIA